MKWFGNWGYIWDKVSGFMEIYRVEVYRDILFF